MLGVEEELKATFVANGQVRFIFNPVLNHGDRSIQSHMASECAGDQGQFWPFRKYLFQNQDRLWRGDIRQTVKALAVEFGLESVDFNACIDQQRHLARLNAQDVVRQERGVTSQPMFDVVGDLYGGTAPLDGWTQVINGIIGQ